jgi:mono/diheme cytochrome c family protein
MRRLAHAALIACSLAPCSVASTAEAATLPVPLGATQAQVLLGERIFHGQAAAGKCSQCHGNNAKGTPTGSDLTTGMWIWGDGSVHDIKATILHNMKAAPNMDGQLAPADVDAVAAYVWAISHHRP